MGDTGKAENAYLSLPHSLAMIISSGALHESRPHHEDHFAREVFVLFRPSGDCIFAENRLSGLRLSRTALVFSQSREP